MRYHTVMNGKTRRIVLEWGGAHQLLDALGVGKQGASLPARLQQLMRQAVRLELRPVKPPKEKLIVFELDENPPPAGKLQKKKRN